MQPADIAKIRTPGSVSLSPDGTRVAFAVSSIEGSAYRSELFVAPTNGSAAPTRLTDGANDSAPRWSPDGRHIAFLRPDAQGRRQLFVMPGGGAARQLTDHPHGVGSPFVSRRCSTYRSSTLTGSGQPSPLRTAVSTARSRVKVNAPISR